MNYPYCISSRRHITGILCAGKMLGFIFMERLSIWQLSEVDFVWERHKRILLLSMYS